MIDKGELTMREFLAAFKEQTGLNVTLLFHAASDLDGPQKVRPGSATRSITLSLSLTLTSTLNRTLTLGLTPVLAWCRGLVLSAASKAPSLPRPLLQPEP